MSSFNWNEFSMGVFAAESKFDPISAFLRNMEGEEVIEDAVEKRLKPRKQDGDHFEQVQDVTDKGREKNALQLPVEAGTRVRFMGNLGAVLAYENPPAPNTEGTVVTVKSAGGDITSHEGMVFVEWPGGEFLPVHQQHLRLAHGTIRQATSNIIRVASLGDLSGFFSRVATDTLVHKATKDLWSVKQDGDSFVIERLFDDSGQPLKC